MLDASEEQWIRSHAWSVEHDFQVHSLYLGEPMLRKNLLCFFDGETLFICCRGLPRSRTEVDEASRSVLSSWPFLRPRRINCWGDRVPQDDSFEEHGYACIYRAAANPCNEEVVVDFRHAPSRQRLARRHREVRRRDRRYECRASDRRGLGWEELSILRKFLPGIDDDLGSIDLSYFLTVPPFLASQGSERVVRIALKVGREMRGFALATIVNPRFGVLHIAAWDRATPRACDALYSAALMELEDRGVQSVSLGVTIHEGLYKYKSKWGARPVGAGFEQAIWYDREDENASDLSAYHWPASLACGGHRNQPRVTHAGLRSGGGA